MDKFATIESQWKSFSAKVLGGQLISKTQYNEMRRAFYAGASAVLAINWEIGDDSVTEEEGMQWIGNMTQEVTEFCEGVKSGKY